MHEGPHLLQQPVCQPVKGWVQNTAPYVFGNQFHYTGCQQHRGGLIPQPNLAAVQALWDEVRRQVLGTGPLLGTSLNEPQIKRDAAAA
ncbi:MAG: hypothetical protein QOK10_1157 [Pseudonocardiales bacterium]|nr:hypothetical protein [Pseudonocardiales bacterium]